MALGGAPWAPVGSERPSITTTRTPSAAVTRWPYWSPRPRARSPTFDLPSSFDRALRALGKRARAPTTHDSTRYGLSRSSPRTFLAHHRAAPLARLVSRRPSFSRTRARDRQYILYIAAPAMSFNLTIGLSPF